MLSEKEEDIAKIKLDSKHSRVRELETELKAYYTESRRLQKLVEQLQVSAKGKQYEDEIGKLKEKNQKFRDLLVKMKQVQDHLKEQNEVLKAKPDEVIQGKPVENQEVEIAFF